MAKSPKSQNDDDNGDGQELDPLIEALLSHLPSPGDDFEQRELWLQLMELILKLVYPMEKPEG